MSSNISLSEGGQGRLGHQAALWGAELEFLHGEDLGAAHLGRVLVHTALVLPRLRRASLSWEETDPETLEKEPRTSAFEETNLHRTLLTSGKQGAAPRGREMQSPLLPWETA